MSASNHRPPLCRTVVALSLAAALAGCSGDKPEQFLAKARQQYESGNKQAAVIELKNAIQKSPEYSDARLLLGKIYLEQGEGASAEKELRKALQLGAPKEVALPQLGRALMLQREFKQVLDELPADSKGKPQEVATLLAVRGDALLALKRLDEAKGAYEEARRLAPSLAEPYQGLAMLANAQQQGGEALRLAEEAIQRAGNKADPWLLKADLLRAQNKRAEAIQAYQEALKREPGNIGAHLSLASLHMVDRQFEAAQREIAAAHKIDANSLPIKLVQAQLDFVQQKFPQARDGLQEILKLAPSYPPAMLMMGATQLGLGAHVQAETYLSAYIKTAPKHAYARRLLATAYLKDKQPAKALDVLNPLLGADVEDGLALGLAGDAYMQLKEYAKATEYLEKAAKSNPANAALQTELAMSRVATGDIARGTAELEAAAGMEGSPLQSDVALIYAYLSKGEFDKALKAIDALDKKQPNNPLTYNLRGGTYVAKKDIPNARKAFEKALSINAAYYPAAANLAQLDLRDAKPQVARSRFEGVLAADKANVAAMLAIASLEWGAGHKQEYVSWLDKAAGADTKAIRPRALLVEYYIAKNDAQRALSIAREAINASPNSVDALSLLGTAQLAAGEKDNAVATFEKLVDLAPQSPRAYLQLASAQLAMKNPADARKALNQALAIKPDLVDAQIAMAGLDVKDGHASDAIKRAQQIQKQYPKAPVGYVLEGDINAHEKQFAKAAEIYQKAFDLGKSGALAMKLHGALAATGKSGDAENVGQQWLKEHPTDNVMRMYLADNYMVQGQDKQAVTQYQAILKSAPDNLVALNNLAWLMQKQHDRQAVTYAEQAYKLRPEDPAIMDTLGWILVEQGAAARGLDLLQRAIAKAPDVLEIRYHLAVALHRKGDTARARTELKRLLDSGTKFPQEAEARALFAEINSGR